MSPTPWFAQPDRRSCGAATMTTARRLLDPEYAARIASAQEFRAETLRLQARLTSSRGADGRRQLPWPRALGTPPWAVAAQLGALTGRRYATRWVVRRGNGAFEAALAAVGPRTPVALYVGSRWLPRHVVLAIGARDGALLVYEPSAGRLRTVHPGPWRWRRLGLAGWSRPWCVIAPDDARRNQA